MGKKLRRLVVVYVAPLVICLLMALLIYALFFEPSFAPFDSWKLSKWSGSAAKIGEGNAERESLNLLFRRTNIPGGYSMLDFKQFLREAYDLKITNILKTEKRPALVLVSRQGSRIFMNEDEMVVMMEELGFRVVVAPSKKMSNLDKLAKVLNSCSVIIGVHGAGLTNAVFLPSGAVMVQVVPLGLDLVSATYFGRPVSQMNVQYLEYKIKPEESSLLEKYGRDHPVIVDPAYLYS